MRVLRSQALTAAGRADEGLAEAEAARAEAERLASPYMLAWCQYILGTVLVARGDERAEHSLSESLRWGRSGDFYLVIGSSLRELGALALRGGREEEAALRFGEAFEHFARPGDCPQVWDVLRAAAPLFLARGRRERAAQILAGADADTRARRPAPLAAPRVSALRAELAAELEQAAAAPQILEELAPQLAAELEQIAAGAPAAPPAGGDGAAPAAAARRFRLEGTLWTLDFDGQVAHMPDLKGLHDLARLLGVPGRELHVLELAGAPGAGRSAEASGEGLGVQGHAGELLDERARAEYRERIRDLSEAAERAAAAGDDERAERAREELDQLTAALAAAFGLGGRARKSGDPAERARSAVTWRIRSALTKIEQAHPPLGAPPAQLDPHRRCSAPTSRSARSNGTRDAPPHVVRRLLTPWGRRSRPKGNLKWPAGRSSSPPYSPRSRRFPQPLTPLRRHSTGLAPRPSRPLRRCPSRAWSASISPPGVPPGAWSASSAIRPPTARSAARW